MSAIKDWGGYSPNPIGDAQLLSDIGMKGKFIPPWVLKTTRWVVDDSITTQDFVGILSYLDQRGLIK
jgi:hypothetical protein